MGDPIILIARFVFILLQVSIAVRREQVSSVNSPKNRNLRLVSNNRRFLHRSRVSKIDEFARVVPSSLSLCAVTRIVCPVKY